VKSKKGNKEKLYYVNAGHVSYPVNSFKKWLTATARYWFEFVKFIGIVFLSVSTVMLSFLAILSLFKK
jgi:hypothetical protein